MEEPKYGDSEEQGEYDKTYNFRSTSTRAKTETKKRGKEDNIISELAQKKNTDINNRGVCPLCNSPIKQEWNVGYVVDGFITNVKEPQRKKVLKEYQYETHHICKKDKEQKQLEVALKELRKKLQEEEETGTEVEGKYKNLQKIHESTKKENKLYQTEILKVKHEKDTAEEVMKALRNANFNKIQISSATYKEEQIQKYCIQYWKNNRA